MAAGLPVIASNSGGINEILNNHQGLIFNRRDIKAIAHCMEEAVMNLKNALNSGHAALERAMDFDVKNIARETFEIYKKYIK